MNIQGTINNTISSVERSKYFSDKAKRFKQSNLMAQRHQGYDSQKESIATDETKKQIAGKKKQREKLKAKMSGNHQDALGKSQAILNTGHSEQQNRASSNKELGDFYEQK